MAVEPQSGAYQYNLGTSGTDKSVLDKMAGVPQLSSDLVILTFMWEHEIPLQPKSIYGGLINLQNITFSYRTVQNKVAQLTERGDLKRVQVDTEEGHIHEMEGSRGSQRSYYLITEQGRERVEQEVM